MAVYSICCIPSAYGFAFFIVHTESEQFQQGFKHSFSGLSPPAA
jgi:recombinational DNA repair protein RecT